MAREALVANFAPNVGRCTGLRSILGVEDLESAAGALAAIATSKHACQEAIRVRVVHALTTWAYRFLVLYLLLRTSTPYLENWGHPNKQCPDSLALGKSVEA